MSDLFKIPAWRLKTRLGMMWILAQYNAYKFLDRKIYADNFGVRIAWIALILFSFLFPFYQATAFLFTV